jgi:hypothetical protein
MYTVLTLSLFFAVSMFCNVWQLIRTWSLERGIEVERLEFQSVKRALQDYTKNLENENRVLHVDVQNLTLINSKLTEQLNEATSVVKVEPQPSVQVTTITEPNAKKKSSRKTKTF